MLFLCEVQARATALDQSTPNVTLLQDTTPEAESQGDLPFFALTFWQIWGIFSRA